MTTMVALLRGINVGGRNKLGMAELRRLAEACGYEQVRTYILCGNVYFSVPAGTARSKADRDPAAVARRLQSRIAAETGLHPDVVVRSEADLAAVVKANPWASKGVADSELHVTFLSDSAPAGPRAVLGPLDPSAYAPEEVRVIGRELHLRLPNGLGRSKLAADLARAKGARGTTRNWRTVTKLLSMAAADEPPGHRRSATGPGATAD
jgi:uncharacterized protein (DUF1697 family)